MAMIIVTHGEYFMAVIAIGLLFAPVAHYLLGGWASKRKEILDNFTDKGIEEYFSLFFPARPKTIKDNLRVDFMNFYDRRFGRKNFIIPGLLLFAVSGFLLFLVSWVVFGWLRKGSGIELDVPQVAIAAFVGAYAWVLLDLIAKAHLYDLKPTNLLTASFRLVLSAPLGLAVAALLKDEVGIPVALFLGAFPTRTITTMARRKAGSHLNLENPSNHGPAELQTLQGLNRDVRERFEQEGVSTILQLAYSDPIVLTMRTYFSFSYVVDCCSQALAWLYFEDKLNRLRSFGLRGAQEINTLIGEIDDSENRPDCAKRASQCLNVAAAELEMDSMTFEWILREVAEDPYTEFLCEIWCSDSVDKNGGEDLQE